LNEIILIAITLNSLKISKKRILFSFFLFSLLISVLFFSSNVTTGTSKNDSITIPTDVDSKIIYQPPGIDNIGPEFIWVKHTPDVPVDGDSIEISAKITDLSGIKNVTLRLTLNNEVIILQSMENLGESLFSTVLDKYGIGTVVVYTIQAYDSSPNQNGNTYESRAASFAILGIINPISLMQYPLIALAQTMIYTVILSTILFGFLIFIQIFLTPIIFFKYKPEIENEKFLQDKRIFVYCNFTKILAKIPYITALASIIAFMLLVIFILTDQMNIVYVAENSSKQAFWFFKLGALYVNEEGSLLFWGTGLAISCLITSRIYFKVEKQTPDLIRKKIDSYWLLLIISYLVVFTFWMALLIDSPFAINDSLINSLGHGLGPIYQNYWVVVHAWFIFVSFIFLFRPTLKASITGNLFHPEDSMITELRLGWGFLTLGMLTGMAWAYDLPGFPTMWNWDPVLIVVFILWLAVTGLLHINIFLPKKSQKFAIHLLGIIIPIFMIVGTIINRTRVFILRHRFGSDDVPVWQLTDFYFLLLILIGLLGLGIILLLSLRIIISGIASFVRPVLHLISQFFIYNFHWLHKKWQGRSRAKSINLNSEEVTTEAALLEEKPAIAKTKSENKSIITKLLKTFSIYKIGRIILWTWILGMIWLFWSLITLNRDAFSGESLGPTEYFYIRMLYWALLWLSFFFIYLWRYQLRTRTLSYKLIIWGWIIALLILSPLIQIVDEFHQRGPISLQEQFIYIILISFIISFSIILTQWFYYFKQIIKSLIFVRKSFHIRKQLYKLASHTIHLGLVLIILGGVGDGSWVESQSLEITESEPINLNNLEINLEGFSITNNHVKLFLKIYPFMEWLSAGDFVFFQLRISRFIVWNVILEGDIIDNIENTDNNLLMLTPSQQTISSISEAWSINLMQITGNISNLSTPSNLKFHLKIDHRPFLPQFWIGAVLVTLGAIFIVFNPKRAKKKSKTSINRKIPKDQ